MAARSKRGSGASGRAVSVDCRHSGFVCDVVQQCPILSGVFRFWKRGPPRIYEWKQTACPHWGFAAGDASHAPVPPNKLYKAGFVPPPSASTLQILQNIRKNQVIASTGAEPAGFVNLDAPKVFNCNLGVGTYIYEFQAMVQVLNALTSNRSSICFVLDDNYVNYCHIIGTLPIDGNYNTITLQTHAFAVKRGIHKVSAQLYTDLGVSDINMYDVTYKMFTRY